MGKPQKLSLISSSSIWSIAFWCWLSLDCVIDTYLLTVMGMPKTLHKTCPKALWNRGVLNGKVPEISGTLKGVPGRG